MPDVHSSSRSAPKWRRFLRWPLRIVTALVAVLALGMLAGTAHQSIAGRLNMSEYPRPGRIIHVGGHRLHLHCTGQGSPTVVLESGLGEGMLAWRKVQPDVSQWTRVCSYDRAGYGWSERGPQPRTGSRLAAELRALLRQAGVEGPLVLVGHSIGGVYLQFFAATYPDEVAGMILVDATHEDTFENLPKLPDWTFLVMRALRAAGINRLFPQSADPTERAFINSNKQLSAMADEASGTAESLAELKATPMSLEDRPLIVLTREQPNRNVAPVAG